MFSKIRRVDVEGRGELCSRSGCMKTLRQEEDGVLKRLQRRCHGGRALRDLEPGVHDKGKEQPLIVQGMLAASNAVGKADQGIRGPVCPTLRDGQLPPKTMLPEYTLISRKSPVQTPLDAHVTIRDVAM